MNSLLASIRLVVASLLVCCVAYPALVLGFAQVAFRDSANGQLVRTADGTIVGSRLIAQAFTAPRYFWPRPSAANFDASAAAGSNLSPTNPQLAQRARDLITRYAATTARPVPADLVAASGSGLDPHITELAARYQIERVARARGISDSEITALIGKLAFAPGGTLAPERIVNVLELNLALDRLATTPRSAP